MNWHNETLDVPHKREGQECGDISVSWNSQQWVDICNKVVESGCYNFQRCKINVNSNWNIPLLESLLSDYWDKEIIKFLQFGFPVERSDNVPLEMGGINHKGATDYEDHVDEYIKKEIELNSTIGPFENIPFKGNVAVGNITHQH